MAFGGGRAEYEAARQHLLDPLMDAVGLEHNRLFVAFLAGVCVIATGLTFLETIANPYTTVLGDQRYAATRINQIGRASCRERV